MGSLLLASLLDWSRSMISGVGEQEARVTVIEGREDGDLELRESEIYSPLVGGAGLSKFRYSNFFRICTSLPDLTIKGCYTRAV